MAYGMPLWNEETGWTPLDELPPGTLPTNSGLITGVDPWGGGQPLPSSTHMTEYQDPRVLGSPQMLSGARSRGNTTPTTPPNSTAGNDAFNAVFGNGTTPRNTTSTGMPTFAPTGAQVQANPSAYAGTSFDPARNLTSGYPTGGANSMGMTGAGTTSYNGQTYGGYTGANAPLNSQLFNQQNGATQPQLDYVRNIDQVNYYKYILPLQQAGLIDISNPQQVNAAIQQGLARDGGGQWASGSKASNVQSSPYSAFLTSGDPRAQAINQFMLSGDQNAIAAAQDWMGKNVRADGSTASQLDNIDSWKQRFNSIYFPSGQFNAGSVSSGGSGSGPTPPLPPPGGGGQQTPNTDWYAEANAENPAKYTQYNTALDNWAASKLDPNLLNRLQGKKDPASLAQYRQALDQIRQQYGYQTWGNISQQATGNSNQAWLAQGYENSPYAPTVDPGQYFKWNWEDADPNDPSNPMSWYLQMQNPQNYQQLVEAVNYYNQNLQGKGGLLQNPFMVGNESGAWSPIAESLMPFKGTQAWQAYNDQINNYLIQSGAFDPNSPFLQNNSWQTDSAMAQQFLQASDALRKQMGYFSNDAIRNMATTQNNPLPLNSFAGVQGTPFRPNQAPGQGFQWAWMDEDGEGGAPGTWGQKILATPTTLQQATEYSNYMNSFGNQGSSLLFGGNNFGNMFESAPRTGGGWTYKPKQSYFQPQQTTPPPGGGGTGSGFNFDLSTIFGGNYSAPPPQYSPAGSGTGTGTGSTGTPPGGAQQQGGPFGGATGRAPKFANNYNLW